MDNFFGSNSRSSLQETIRAQQERLAKYEKKLGDLVKAYKSLQEEKKALQETVNALSSQPDHGEGNVSSENPGASDDKLRQQVAALTKTLASLNETKNTLESRFQNDKKELREQVENLKACLVAEESCTQRERADHETSVKTMKNKLRHEQHEREQEQTHHVAMLRELQHMLAAERNANQKLELELDELRSSRNFDKQRAMFAQQLEQIAAEKARLAAHVADLELKVKENKLPDNYVVLQSEVEDLRIVQAQYEELKGAREKSAYQHLNLQTSADQNRIRDLENRLTELSELIADYDATQKTDQVEITRLQKRVTTLESIKPERRSVNVSVNTNIVIDSPPPPPEPTSPTSPRSPAQGTVAVMRSPAQAACEGTVAVMPLHLATKNREAELTKLKNSLRIFKQEIKTLQGEKKQQQLNLVKLTEEHKQQLAELSTQHSLEICELDKGHALRLSELQESSTKARLRSQGLVEEKEEEVAEMKCRLEAKNKPAPADSGVIGELLTSVETENVPRTLVFYKQQYKFISDELSKAKKGKETLEQSMREKERNEHVYVGEIANLKVEVRRLIRNSSRESANLEYLKNIVLRYLRATSSSEKRQILLAIFTVLEFSELEKESVKHKLVLGWFS